MMTEQKEILQFFKQNDPILYPYINKFKDDLVLKSSKPSNYFQNLCREIAFQQLNGKAARTIWGRFEDLFPKKELIPANVLKITVEQMRSCGLSNAKANYIHNIARAFMDDANYLDLHHLSDEEVIELLTKIKGVGKWTSEMFLMFNLGREDIFSMGDFGLKKGFMKIYGYKKEPSTKTIERITKKWKPYRTYGSLVLWRTLDTK